MTSPESDQSFRIPEPAERRRTPLRRKELRRWIDALPMANVEGALRSLAERMDETNRHAMEPVERREMLEALRQPADLLLREQEARHARSPSLREKDRRLAALAQRLRVTLVVGYKILVRDLHSSWLASHLLHRKMRVEALHRQIHYLGRILLADCQLYLPPTSRVWIELHHAYHYAEAARIQAKPVSNEDPETVARSTISDQYKLWLLLALAGPYRLQQGEANLVYRVLQSWVPQCRLYPAGKRPPMAGEFAIDRNSDRPPVSLGQMEEGGFEGWYLDVAPMALAVQEYLEKLPDSRSLGAPRPALDAQSRLSELLPRLLFSWGVQPTRAAPREEPGGQLAVVCGLETIHRLFTSGGSAQAGGLGREPKPGFVAARASSAGRDEFERLEGASQIESIRLQASGRYFPVWASGNVREAENRVHDCEIYDRSQSGYHLTVLEPAAGCLRVGELLAVNESPDEGPQSTWRLASVRWIRRGHGGTLEFGAQLFSGAVEAVSLERRRKGSGPTAERWIALLLGAGSYHQETLIAPAFYAEPESSFVLVQKHGKEPINLVHVVETTPCFAQFRFAPLY